MKEPEVIKKLMKLIEEQTIEPKKKCKHEIESNMVPAYCRKCGKDMSEPKKKELRCPECGVEEGEYHKSGCGQEEYLKAEFNEFIDKKKELEELCPYCGGKFDLRRAIKFRKKFAGFMSAEKSEAVEKELVEDSWEVQFDNLFYTTQPVKEFIRDLVRQVEKKARKDERKRILEWMIKNFEKDNDQFGGIVIYEDLKEYLSSLNQSNN